MDAGDNSLVVLGSITAALIAAVISLVQLVTSKEQSIAQARQARIAAITTDLAMYLAQIELILRLVEVEPHELVSGLSQEQLKKAAQRQQGKLPVAQRIL